MEEKKVLLSIKDLEVKFRVRGRILTAIRGISLDIYEHESIAIVGLRQVCIHQDVCRHARQQRLYLQRQHHL